ncbi:MAG: LysR family transcriptional regulator [Lachnospiraceae bacterium]|nr:LysR family transcriptional regulator [Lachnospiraceae bacterium]
MYYMPAGTIIQINNSNVYINFTNPNDATIYARRDDMISNLEYYRAFYYVASLESFSAAAEQLHLTQSAISQSVKKLEDALSCKLFVRNAKKTLLTGEGKQLYQHVKNAFSEFQSGENAVSDMMLHRRKEIKIGATETTIRFFLPEYLHNWEAEHPDSRLTLVGSTTSDLCEMLKSHAIEQAFLISPLPEEFRDAFQLKKIGELSDVPVVSKAFFKTMGYGKSHRFTIQELQQFPLIFVSEENSVRKLFDQWFLTEHCIFHPQYTVPHMGLVHSLIHQGLGIGFLPLPYAEEAIKNEGMIQLKTTTRPETRTVYLAF